MYNSSLYSRHLWQELPTNTICTYVDEMETLDDSLDDDLMRKLVMKDPNKLKVFASVLLHSEVECIITLS